MANSNIPKKYEITLFFDGDCPLCSREVRYLERKDSRGVIRFVDISTPDFDPAIYSKTKSDFMRAIHAELPDGTLIEGMEVFRRIYQAIGYGFLLKPTKLPILKQIFDFAYYVFAKNRIRIGTLLGRCGLGRCSIN